MPGSPDVTVLTAGTQWVGGSLDNITFSYDGASAAYTLFAVDLRFGPGFQFNISGLGTIEVYAVNTVINSGTWNIGAPGRGGRLILTRLETDGQLERFTNAGILNVAHGATVQATGDREGVFLNSGTLSVGSGGLFTYGNLAGPVGPTFRNSGRVNLTGVNSRWSATSGPTPTLASPTWYPTRPKSAFWTAAWCSTPTTRPPP